MNKNIGNREIQDPTYGVISNGKILAYTAGAEISQLRVNGYTSPSVLAVNPDFGELFLYSESDREEGRCAYIHNVFSIIYGRTENDEKIPRVINDIRIRDTVDTDGVFVRYCDAIRPFKLNFGIAPYVRKSLIRGYRIGRKNYDVLCLTLPAGVGFYKNETTHSETRILIVVDGDAQILSDADTVEVFHGSSRIVIASGNGEQCLRGAEKILASNPHFGGASDVFAEQTSGITEKLLCILTSHQSECGGVIASRSEPIIRSTDIHIIVSAFLKYGLFDRARRSLEFFCKRFDGEKSFFQIYGTEQGQKERYFSDVSLACASIMSAMLNYVKVTGDKLFLKENLKMMKSAMYAQLDECALGMMSFSGVETELEDGLANAQCRACGSLEATLAAASSILDFSEYCEENSIKLPNDNGSAARRAREMLGSVKEHFVDQNRVALSAPERVKAVKLPRFSYGDCEVCARKFSHIYYGELERTQNGLYVCPNCYCDNSESEDDFLREQRFSVLASAILLSEKHMRDLLGQDASRDILLAALERRRENREAKSVRADTLLLSLAREYRLDDDAKLLENDILKEASFGKLVNENFDTKTVASILCVLKDEDNK